MSQVYVGNGSGGGGPSTDLHVARFIVSAGGTADGANYTTIASAYAAAVAAGGNQTIFIQPGTYSENLTLTAGINLTAFDCDAFTPNVTINGKMTANITGNCSFSGIFFVNDFDNILAVSGSGACTFLFNSCWIQVGGASFAITNSNSSCKVTIQNSQGDISGTSSYFNFSAGGINFQNSYFFNGIESTTASLLSSPGALNILNSTFNSQITSSGALSSFSIQNSQMILSNITAINCGGANALNNISDSLIDSNTATAITISSGSSLYLFDCSIGSSNTNAISGAGTLLYSPITFTKSSSTVSVSTQTPLRFGPQISPELANTNGTVYYDGTIIKTNSPGTAGQVWTSNGAGSAPSFQNASGGSSTSFSVAMNSAQTISQNTLTKVVYDTVLVDTASAYSGGTYTIPTTGNWLITVVYNFTTAVSFINCDVFVNKNVGTYQLHLQPSTPTDGATANNGSGSGIFHFTAGDTVEIDVFSQTTGGANLLAAGVSNGYFNVFSGVLLP